MDGFDYTLGTRLEAEVGSKLRGFRCRPRETLEAARLRASEDGLGLLASIVDVDPGYLSRVLRGKQSPSKKVLISLDAVLFDAPSKG